MPRAGAAQGGVGGEQDAAAARDGLRRPVVGEGEDVVLVAAEFAPVAPGVVDQARGLGDPQRASRAAQPAVEDHGRGLASLAAAGAVAEHPALAELDGLGEWRVDRHRAVEGAAVFVDGDRADVVGVDAVVGGQQAFVGVSGQGDAFELRVGQQAVEGEERRQEGAVLGDGWGDVGHRGGLDQRRRVLDGAGDPEGDGSPLRPGGVAAAHLLRVAVDFLDVEAARARIEGQARRQRGDQAHQLLEVVDDRERVDIRIARGGRSGGAFEDQEARFDAGAAAPLPKVSRQAVESGMQLAPTMATSRP